MIPRKRLDISWGAVWRGGFFCARPTTPESFQKRIESAWSPGDTSLVCLSVRSGFDALLGALALPPGSELLVSAVTIPDIVRIVEAHGLVPVPVDIDMHRLALRSGALARAVTPRARAVLVAHLFGSRMPMEEVLQVARENGLLVIEDCAQAYAGDGFRGHPESDVRMFSFGVIKTATALGGGILSFRQPELGARVRLGMSAWPEQGRWRFLARVAKCALLMLLSFRPLYSLFAVGCRACGIDYDRAISGMARGFRARDLFARIRQRPAPALLALLDLRLRTYDPAAVAKRVALACRFSSLMPALTRPGAGASHHTYWLFPILHQAPEALVRHLWANGFDATQGGSSLVVVRPPEGRPAARCAEAEHALARVLYLPVNVGLSRRDIRRLARAVNTYSTC